MPAPKAKRPANAPKGSGAHQAAAAARALRPRGAARIATRKSSARKPETEVLRGPGDGPGYQFVGFRLMCRQRHLRH